MFKQVYSATICGANSQLILVEADVSSGFPSYTMVGYLASEVREARERVITALKNVGIAVMTGRIIVNLSPAGIRKEGTAYDLSIAMAIMNAMNVISDDIVENTLILGELSLDGTVRGVRGILPMLSEAKRQGICRCIVPEPNIREAALVSDMKIMGISNLKDIIALRGGTLPYDDSEDIKRAYREDTYLAPKEKMSIVQPSQERDFSEVYGQEMMKLAIQTAVAGHHHLLMIGTPGSGKSLAASCIPSILPEMTEEEQLEVTKLHSIAGLFLDNDSLMDKRPFRQPHHSITVQALVGGGVMPRPGEISLAHKGVLFLDEFAEFRREAIETLRQPLENRQIMVDRVHGNYIFPGDFMLVAAMNPCPCGYYPDRQHCCCTNQKIRKYLGKISGPMLDRFDISIEVQPVKDYKFKKSTNNLSSKQMKKSVDIAMDIQQNRYKHTNISYNSQIPASLLEKYCPMTVAGADMLQEQYEKNNMSMRAYHKILRTSRTIADIDQSEKITENHVAEALCYRGIDHNYWMGEQML